MTSRSTKQAESTSEDEQSSGSVSGREEEKTIPFLRRLRDMLVENEEVISFAPGYRKPGHVILGKIIVHDRVQVEANVLPRYFNHSSFASLRRQLNYFNFVRQGKGRQKESTYTNENVVLLEDVLHLKRRSGSHAATVIAADQKTPTKLSAENEVQSSPIITSDISKLETDEILADGPMISRRSAQKRRRLVKKSKFATAPPPTSTSQDHTCISEDDSSEGKSIALDLTVPPAKPVDCDILAGCSALLDLAAHRWA